MFAVSNFARTPIRLLGAVATLLIGSILVAHRAEALSPINPGLSHGKAAASELTIEVHGGGHGGGGGRGGGGGFGAGRGAVGGFAVGGANSAAVRGGAIGAGAAAVGASPRFVGRSFVHRRHFGGVFVGGVYYDDYPYDDGDYYVDPPTYSDSGFAVGGSCRRVLTVNGPRVFCRHRAVRRHHVHHRRHHYHHRRHHRA